MIKYVNLSKKLIHIWKAYLKRGVSNHNLVIPTMPHLSIETTNICNSRCVFCVNPHLKRPRETMTMPLFEKIIDEYAAMGGTEVDFNATIGEPLLDKHLIERARYVKRYPQFKTNGFVTNLQWLHLHDLDAFFTSGFTWVSVSTVLSGREQYRSFFGVDAYEQMLSNLERLLIENHRRKKLSIQITIKPTDELDKKILTHPDYLKIMKLTKQDLDAFIRERTFFVDDWIGSVRLPSYLKRRPLYPRRYRPCRLLYSGRLMVFSNGKVGVCSCRDYEANSELILGNALDVSLHDVWHGNRLAEITSNWLKKNIMPAICKSCRHYLY